jgi:hypothetical protein
MLEGWSGSILPAHPGILSRLSGAKIALAAAMRLPALRPALLLFMLASSLSGCVSLFEQTSSTGAAIAGSAAASGITHDAALATGIGLGVEALASRGVRVLERHIHADEQQAIASAAGPLDPDQVAQWSVHHSFALEPDEQGQVSVTREVKVLGRVCKEIVFTVNSGEEQAPGAFLADVCSNGSVEHPQWAWALAEPSTSRWGVLQ